MTAKVGDLKGKMVKASEINDDNILQALEEFWVVEGNIDDKPKGIDDSNLWSSLISPLLNDPRDVSVVNVALLGTLLPMSSFCLYFFGTSIYQMAFHCVLLAVLTRRYVLALHVSSHKALFQRQYSYLNSWIPVALGPFFGQTPYTYYWHHLKMHHVTDNGLEDLSSTLLFQRDKFTHFLQYFFRFYFFVMFELANFFAQKGNSYAAGMVAFNEIATMLSVVFLAYKVNFIATFFSFILPFNIVRFGMMQGNWVQHSFIERDNPFGGGLRNSITLINCAYNKECFNDGYHASHHLNPLRHFSAHPAELIRNRQVYHDSHAIVFKQTSYDELWLFLMTRNYDALAEKWVHVGPVSSPAPTKEQIISRLKEKTLIFSLAELKKKL